jgi:FkbM family methyltransferase
MTSAMRSIDRELRTRISAVRRYKQRRDFQSRTHVESRSDLVFLGTPYGGWTVASGLLHPGSVCYLAGIGEDITFDLHLIARFGCTVHAFDPVPQSQRYAEISTVHEPRFHLHRFGLWSSDTVLEFHEPERRGYISHSATNLKRTEVAFAAQVRSLRSVTSELGHSNIDLLKLSVEGSEYELIENLVSERIPVRMLAVEYAQPAPLDRIESSIDHLRAAQFVLTDVTGWKLLFVNTDFSE